MKLSNYLKITAGLLVLSASPAAQAASDILNASYDISRELFEDINPAFVKSYQDKSGQTVEVKQSHAGSSKQARSILEGLQADVVTFNQVNDVLVLADGGYVAKDWASKFPNNASPFYSVHGILVRAGNPKGIKDWGDLTKPGVRIIQVNPKTGGNGRYAVLAYYAYGLEKFGGDKDKARDFLKKVLANVAVFESGGRAATSTFTERGIGDVLVNFEAETLALSRGNSGKYQAVTPSVSILSEFPVAVVNKVANKRGTADIANAYLEFLYTPAGQEILAKNYYRPRNEEIARRYASNLKQVKALEVDQVFGGWKKATAEFFDNGALVDKLLAQIAAERR